MRHVPHIVFAAALLAAPGLAAAQSTGQSQDHAQGFNHVNGPATTGQPGAECGDEDSPNRPGNAQDAPGSAFNPDGTAGTHYAGEQPQNSRNTASVSQYDAACLHQPL
jgi:hypothetical protein